MMEDNYVPDAPDMDLDAMLAEEEEMEHEAAEQHEFEQYQVENGFMEPDDVDLEVKGQEKFELAPKKSSVVNEVMDVKSFDDEPMSNKISHMTPSDIAAALQYNRSQAGFGSATTSSATHSLLNVVKLATKNEEIDRISSEQAEKHLHSQPKGDGYFTARHQREHISGTSDNTDTLVRSKQSSSAFSDGNGHPLPVPTVGREGEGEDSPAHLTCVLANGKRVFLAKRSRTARDTTTHSSGSSAEANAGLLGQPMSALLEEARLVQVRCEAQRVASISAIESSKRELHAGNAGNAGNLPSAIEQAEHTKGQMLSKELWVNKHAPRSFSQLLSPERTNRDVLRALKQWDRYVFKKADSDASDKAKGVQQNHGSVAGSVPDSSASQSKESSDSRPEQKVILLSGPPGTGKTTLAHIVAKHCGYRAYEINASDDRTADVLRDHLMRAMHGNTLSGDNLPNCLILDEIDGIDSRASIDALTAIIRRPLKRKKGGGSSDATGVDGEEANEGGGAEQNRVGGKGKFALTRPLICICNDQYAPVLRDLRKYAQIFVFPPPLEKRLIMRLKAIATQERLQVSVGSLTTLAAASVGDIRSCINTLQFAALRADNMNHLSTTEPAKKESLADVLSSMIACGLKDQSRDVFQVWREVFSQQVAAAALAARMARVEAKPIGETHRIRLPSVATTAAGTRSKSRDPASESLPVRGPIMECMSAMQECGDSQLVLRGLFHNLLRVHFQDPSFNRISTAAEWLSKADMFESLCYGSGGDSFALAAYVPMSAAAIHMLCAADGRSKVEWPLKDRDLHYRRQQHEHILQSMQVGNRSDPDAVENSSGSGVSLPHAQLSRTLCSKDMIVLDLLSPLMDIISPKVRPVAFITLGSGEQASIEHAVQAMASTGLVYHMQTKDMPNGAPFTSQTNTQLSLVLDPAVHHLVQYTHPQMRDRRHILPYETRNNIFMELKKYLINLSEGGAGKLSETVENTAENKHGSPVKRDSSAPPTATPASTSAARSSKRALGAVASPEAFSQAAEAEARESLKRARANSIDKAPDKDNSKPHDIMGHFKRLPPKTSKAANNFFGRSAMSVDNDSVSSRVGKKLDQNDKGVTLKGVVSLENGNLAVRFKFNQGFSNAVRRPVNISDFL